MCLIVKPNQRIQTAKSDIICYKFVRIVGNEILTPFQSSSVKLGETYKSEIIRQGNEINEALHSFVNLKDFERYLPLLKQLVAACFTDYRIVECIIPKGSKYIKGLYDSSLITYMSSYASNKIMYRCML